ncbi:MAG: glycosyltransferase family 4 protein [Balneola sp.]|nr:glycosyltransferase family 4 protein [Balneola sp.]
MNIAIVTHVTPGISNGLSQYIRFLIKGLIEASTDHHFFIFVNKSFDSFLDIDHPNFTKIRVDIPHSPRILMRPIYFIWQNLFSGELFKKYNIDIIHFPNPVPLITSLGLPTVVTIHDTAELRGERHTKLHKQFRIWVNNNIANRAEAVLTVSQFSKSEICSLMNVKEEKIHVTELGITINNNIKILSHSKASTPYFLHVGGGSKNKNLDRVIEAFLQLNKSRVLNLKVVGRTEQFKRFSLDFEALKKEGIYFTGYLSENELIKTYKNAMALVYPSLYEGFGLPILEALSMGIPVITSNRASMPEVAGKAAIYVDPEDISSIKNGLNLVLNDNEIKNRLKKEGILRSKQFDWLSTARKTLRVYEKAGNN